MLDCYVLALTGNLAPEMESEGLEAVASRSVKQAARVGRRDAGTSWRVTRGVETIAAAP